MGIGGKDFVGISRESAHHALLLTLSIPGRAFCREKPRQPLKGKIDFL
jgi:hypothetical protein